MTTSISNSIGNTALMDLNVTSGDEQFGMLVKLEFLNPSGSIKDRIAKYMVELAEKHGSLKKGCTIVEATSGNTGIALSMVAAAKGYRMLVVMPEHMSKERIEIMQNLGADVCLTPKELGFEGAVKRAEEIAKSNEKMFYTNQFANPANVLAHYYHTGREIVEQTERRIDILVAGVGTGGTLMGVGRALKERNPYLKIVALEPEEAPALSGGKTGDHKIPGIGDGFVPSIVNMKEINEIVTVKSDDAIAMAKRLNNDYGLMVGISSGANVLGTIKMLKKYGKDKTALTFLPDRTERYFSTELYSEKYTRSALRTCKRDRECVFIPIKSPM